MLGITPDYIYELVRFVQRFLSRKNVPANLPYKRLPSA